MHKRILVDVVLRGHKTENISICGLDMLWQVAGGPNNVYYLHITHIYVNFCENTYQFYKIVACYQRTALTNLR